jgi:hypothetical protein
MTQRRTLLVLGLIFIGLIVWTVIGRISPPPTVQSERSAVIEDQRVYDGVSLAEVMAVRLRSPQTEAVFAVARDTAAVWQVVEGSGMTITSEAADALALTVIVLPYLDTLTPDADLTLYGFEPEGILSIELVLDDGTTSAVAVGYRTPTELGYYAFIDSRPELYILDRAPVDYLISILRNPPTA